MLGSYRDKAQVRPLALRNRRLVDLAAEAPPPRAGEFLARASPNHSLEGIAAMTAEQREGLLRGRKGRLFEVDVRERLSAGETIGDLRLEQGQQAVLAESRPSPV